MRPTGKRPKDSRRDGCKTVPGSRSSINMAKKWITLVVVVAAIGAIWFLVQRDQQNTIEYRGQKIKLSRRYTDFSTYKNDPENIDSSETARVQRLVREAPIGKSFDSRLEFAQATGDIAFPGYGSSGLRDTRQSDGSILVLTSIEIPRAEADRYFTAQISNGKYLLIDDFTAPESANLQRVEKSAEKLVYLNEQGETKLVRAIH